MRACHAYLSGKSVVELAIVMRICDRWMQEDTTDRRSRSHPPQCTTSRDYSTTDVSAANGAMKEGCGRQNGMKLSLLTSHDHQHHDGRIRVWRHHGERILNSCVIHRHTGRAPGIMVWGGIGYHTRTPLVRIAGTLNSHRYISPVLEPVVLPYLQGLATTLFQQDNARPHVARIVQRFFVNHQIKLLPWPARCWDLSPIENMRSMVV
ncbi:hypothetical protein TNCV_335291 [Trichonephila clavipes]|nr:hypothetical protein TNCV_335291 [Trichonephila clavipes]